VYASIENGFVLNTKFCVKGVIGAHDKMDGNYCEMYFAEKLLPSLPPQYVIVVNSASHQLSTKSWKMDTMPRYVGPVASIFLVFW
jgi:hypothetical protein